MQSIASAGVCSTPSKTWSSRAEPVSARPSSYRGTAVLMRSARRPVHPGRFLESRFMQPGGITQDALARAMGVSRRRVNELIRGRRSITPDTAIRLALFFGTDATLWIELQMAWDMHRAWRTFRQSAQ
jgi:addiction module HigA family antidote